jgi:hypothetical protein
MFGLGLFNVPQNKLSRVIWALDSLKFVVAAHIKFEPSSAPIPPMPEENPSARTRVTRVVAKGVQSDGKAEAP